MSIGHYVDTLNEIAEDRLLTETMGACVVSYPTERDTPGCVLQIAGGDVRDGWIGEEWNPAQWQIVTGIGYAYDNLLKRFGAPRINAAIRNRILSNRARRILTGQVVRCDAEQVPA